jgi:hypothetical protein
MYGKDAIGGGFGGFGGFESSTLGGAGFMGGFFPSPQKQGGGGNSPMQAPRRDTVSSRDTQGLMAVTVKMVLEGSSEMSDSNLLKFHGNHEASMIELIGQVENVEDSDNMYLRYVIDDGTGRMVCKKLIEQDRPRDTSRVFPGRFVRVVGSFRHFGSETYVNAHKIEEVVNLDDISRHRIEVAYTMLQLSGQLGEDPASGVVSGMHASVSSARESM